jgi:hypothetical protein
MNYSKSKIMSRAYKIPELKFEGKNLTSFWLEIENRLPKLIIEHLKKIGIYRISLAFDGSVFWTQTASPEGSPSDITGRKREPAAIALYSVPSPKQHGSSSPES